MHVVSREMLMSLDLNPEQRATTSTSTLTRIGSPTLSHASRAAGEVPGFVPFTAAVNQPLNIGEIDYDALLAMRRTSASANNYSAHVSYTLSHARGNTSGNGAAASNFQVAHDMHLELNEGPTDFDIRHNFVRQRHGARAAHRRPERSAGWRAR